MVQPGAGVGPSLGAICVLFCSFSEPARHLGKLYSLFLQRFIPCPRLLLYTHWHWAERLTKIK